MDKQLKKLIDSSVNHIFMASRLEILAHDGNRKEIFDYIAEAGERELNKVFGMDEFDFLLEIEIQSREISKRISEIKKGE